MSTISRRRRTRRPGTKYQGRSYGTGPIGREKPAGPSKRHAAADQALADILELFESESLPGAIARTWIARQEGTSPMVAWSLNNQLLAMLAGTEDARGFRQWEHAGRHVVKGAKAFYILGPATRKIRETDAETGTETERAICTGFVAIPVFRLADTQGAAVDPPDYQPPEPPPLSAVAAAWGIPVNYGPMLGQTWLGLYRYDSAGRETITLASHDDAVYLHELSHAAHRRALAGEGHDLGAESTARRETVAELTAAVLGRLYGLEVGNVATARDYIASYAKGNPGRAAMQVLGDVQKCLAAILDASAEAELTEVAA